MESSLTQITNYLLTQSWQIAVLTLVIALISFLLKNKSAHIRYLLWMIVLAKCIVPPFYNIPLAILPEEELIQSNFFEPAPEYVYNNDSLPDVIPSEASLPSSFTPEPIATELESQPVAAENIVNLEIMRSPVRDYLQWANTWIAVTVATSSTTRELTGFSDGFPLFFVPD